MSIRTSIPQVLALLAILALPAASAFGVEAVIEEGGIAFDLPEAWSAKMERTRIPSGQLMQRWVRSSLKTREGSAAPGLIAIATPVPEGASLALLTQSVLARKPYGVRLGIDTSCLKCVKYAVDTPNGTAIAEAPDLPAACSEPAGQSGIHDCRSVDRVGLRIEPSWIHTYEKTIPNGRMKVLHAHLLNDGKLVDISFWYPIEIAGAVETEIFPVLASMRRSDTAKAVRPDSAGKQLDAVRYRRDFLPRLLDELPRQLPEGLALSSVRQNESQLVLTGHAQSNARVAEFMRKLSASEVVSSPDLAEVKAMAVGNRRLNEFSLKVLPRPPEELPETKAGNADPCGVLPPMLAGAAEVESMFIEINNAALTQGMSFELFRPGQEKRDGSHATIPVAIRVTGSYNGLRRFINGLRQLPALMEVGDFSIRTGQGDDIAFDAVISIYRTLGRAVKPAQRTMCGSDSLGDVGDPFARSLLAPKPLLETEPGQYRRKGPLEAYSLDSLSFIGTLNMHGKLMAIVRADKSVHQVRIGDRLGPNSGVITGITESEVQLRELLPDGADGYVERNSTLPLRKDR